MPTTLDGKLYTVTCEPSVRTHSAEFHVREGGTLIGTIPKYYDEDVSVEPEVKGDAHSIELLKSVGAQLRGTTHVLRSASREEIIALLKLSDSVEAIECDERIRWRIRGGRTGEVSTALSAPHHAVLESVKPSWSIAGEVMVYVLPWGELERVLLKAREGFFSLATGCEWWPPAGIEG